MNQPTHHQIATYLTDYVLSELVRTPVAASSRQWRKSINPR